jgi:hypothetical protein
VIAGLRWQHAERAVANQAETRYAATPAAAAALASAIRLPPGFHRSPCVVHVTRYDFCFRRPGGTTLTTDLLATWLARFGARLVRAPSYCIHETSRRSATNCVATAERQRELIFVFVDSFPSIWFRGRHISKRDARYLPYRGTEVVFALEGRCIEDCSTH